MGEISELERRISAAIDRVGVALDRIQSGPSDDLAAALEAERTANAQLEARVAAIKQKQETQVAGLEAEVASLREAVLVRDAEVQKLRRVNSELRKSNAALREANQAGLPDPHLVNTSMMAEVEALRALASGTRAEIDEILAALEPLVEEV